MEILFYLLMLIAKYFFLAPTGPNASIPEESYVYRDKNAFTYVEKMPQFPGGEKAMIRFLNKEVTLPPLGKEEQLQTIFLIEFVVDSEGEVVSPRINKKNPEDNMTNAEKAVLQMVRKMPKWKPGEQAGKKVPVQLYHPLKIEIRE